MPIKINTKTKKQKKTLLEYRISYIQIWTDTQWHHG